MLQLLFVKYEKFKKKIWMGDSLLVRVMNKTCVGGSLDECGWQTDNTRICLALMPNNFKVNALERLHFSQEDHRPQFDLISALNGSFYNQEWLLSFCHKFSRYRKNPTEGRISFPDH